MIRGPHAAIFGGLCMALESGTIGEIIPNGFVIRLGDVLISLTFRQVLLGQAGETKIPLTDELHGAFDNIINAIRSIQGIARIDLLTPQVEDSICRFVLSCETIVITLDLMGYSMVSVSK